MQENEIKELSKEKEADRQSMVFISIFVALSWITLSITGQIDAGAELSTKEISQIWLTQLASHVVIIALLPIFPLLLTRFPLRRDNWGNCALGFAAGFCVFGVVHVLGMVAVRSMLWPLLWAEVYEFGLTKPIVWFYELQKDAFTFLLLISVFWTGRELAQASLKEQGRRQAVAETGRLTLHSGGRIHVMDVDDLRYARAAGNYVEIRTRASELLVRMTLRELEERLAAHSNNHQKIHRSTLAHLDEINLLKPNKDGSATITLKDGEALKVSRTLRPKLEEALKAR